MPRVAYSEEEKERIRTALIHAGLARMAKQGVRHTTVEQIYRDVGISRTFFYSFFSTKEDLVVESLYLQQPRILAYARQLMADSSLTWHQAVHKFLTDCCHGEKNGIAVLTVEEQQLIFRRLSDQSKQQFRQRQFRLFADLLQCFGVRPDRERVRLFTNVSLTAMIVRRAIPETLPLFVPQAADATVEFQVNAIVDWLETLRN